MVGGVTRAHAGEWLRARREELQLGIGDVTGVGKLSRQTWYDLEADRHPPSTSTRRKVAEALHVEPDWYDRLLAGERPAVVSDQSRAAELDSLRAELTVEGEARRSELQELRDQVAELDDRLARIAAAVDDLRQGGPSANSRPATG